MEKQSIQSGDTHKAEHSARTLLAGVRAIADSVSCLHCGQDFTSTFGVGSHGSILNGCTRCADISKGYVDLLIRGIIYKKGSMDRISQNDTVNIRFRCNPIMDQKK
jgi:hypothetical protein